ncbi:ABC transporter ATP-binding protein/permease [Streptococcus pasteurianus]|uniref:ABC transporter ATP-binding protein/permease n=1 Tax=Streptococcus pasteurianus TaxID=197614 RepID=UPI002954021D|nr:ABC transporter ATP-binding protein/permease [Streptococcus pasteurianus]WOO58816.1 ABC transporter ATP-binding protein/permease [Streptococcus pasteurianus]
MAENQQKRISRERRKRLLRRLKSEVGPHKRDLYIAAVLSWIQFLMRILSFFLIAKSVEHLYKGEEISLITLICQLLILSAIGFAVSLLAKNYQGTASQYARNHLKGAFFEAFQNHGGEFDDKDFSVADIMNVASQGIDTLDTYFNHYLTISLRAYFNCATVLLLVAFIYPIGGLIFLVSLPFIPVSIILMQKRSKKIMNHYWATYMDVGNLFMDDLKGMNTLYTYDADERYAKTFVEKAEEFRRSTMELLKFQLQSVGYMDGVMYIGVGVSGFAAVVSLSHGHLSLFSLIFFVLIATEFFAPIREMGYGMHLVMMNTKMADRIYTFLDSAAVDDSQENKASLPTDIKEIRFDNVSFSYDNTKILSNLSFTILKGKIFAVAGESGRGKTTIAKLLQKQLSVSEGKIFFGQHDLADVSLDAVKESVMYVSPESYLFNGTIYENLALATDMSQAQLLTWLNQRHLMTFLQDLPEGLQTVVGENGNLLSPGQRQQIICARALLAKRPIYIFDEMTSSIDSENEQLLYDYIKLTAQNAIVLVISHKMKQVLQAEQVLFIDSKRTISLGRPEALLTTNAEFKKLVSTQEELEAILHG